MRSEGSAALSSWDADEIRNRLLNVPPGQDTRSPLREFLDGHDRPDRIQAIRQLEVEEQAILLEIIDQVSRYYPST